MATTLKRTKKIDPSLADTPVADFYQQLVLKNEAEALAARSEEIRKRIKNGFAAFKHRVNDKGSQFYDFATTLVVDGVKYKGMENRRSVTQVFNEKTAERILKRKKLLEEAQSSYIDQDKVYALQQAGKLTEDDVDAMLEDSPPKWSLYPIRGEVL